jgi:hypothetical protein
MSECIRKRNVHLLSTLIRHPSSTFKFVMKLVTRLQTSTPFMLPSKPGSSASETHSSTELQGFEEWVEEAVD